jgi:hypothetical protein
MLRLAGLLAMALSSLLLAAQATKDVVSVETYASLLGALPSAPGRAVQLWINDYAAAAAALGVPRPGPEEADEAVGAYLLALDEAGMPGGPFISGFHPYALSVLPGLRTKSGYDVRDVRASAQDLALTPVRHAVVILDVDPSDVLDSLAESSAWPHPQQEEHNEVSLLIWDPIFTPSLVSRLNAPVFDELGRAAPLAFPEKRVLSASSVEETETMIDACLGLTPSLWDTGTIQSLAEGLARLGAYSCVLMDDASSQSVERRFPSWPSQAVEGVDADSLLRPYEAFGVGVGKDEEGFYMAIVLVHADEAAASANASLLPARLKSGQSLAFGIPWSAWFDTGGVVAEADGSVLLARVPIRPTARADVWVRWFIVQDPLLLFSRE